MKFWAMPQTQAGQLWPQSRIGKSQMQEMEACSNVDKEPSARPWEVKAFHPKSP